MKLLNCQIVYNDFMKRKGVAVPVMVEDNETVQHVLIQANMKAGQVKVISNFDAWENMGLIMEGLGATVQECIRSGISRKQVYDEVERYLAQVLASYDVG